MTVKLRLLFSFGIIIILFFTSGGMSVYQSIHTQEELVKIEKQYKNFAKINLALRNILIIQDILTETAFSHDKTGFKKADEAKNKAEKLLTEVLEKAVESKETEIQTVTESILQRLQSFYSEGVNMANVYIAEGPEAGSIKMKAFDIESETLQVLTDKIGSAVEDKVSGSIKGMTSMNKFLMLIIISIIGFTLLFVIVLAFSTTSFIIKPLSLMVKVSRDIAEGNLKTEVAYKKKNELGLLGENLNTAVKSLRNNILEIQNASDATVRVKDELAASTEETSSAINEISANNISMRNQIDELNRHIMDSTSSITQIDANIKSLGELIDNQASMVIQATAAINQMIASVNNVAAISENKKNSTKLLVQTSRTGGEKLAATNNIIREVADKVGDIQEMMEIINSIASQTNLLSMNAAIEAAHAGDAGKGFAVVADEIRKLAESTSENAKNISSVTGNITENIKSASMAGTETQQAFENIQNEVITTEQALNEISESTKELTVGGEEILKAMTKLTEVSENIKTGAVEMQEGSRIVSGAMNNVEQISNTVTNGMEEVTLGIEEISRAMNDLNNIAQHLGENSDNLDTIIKQFKV